MPLFCLRIRPTDWLGHTDYHHQIQLPSGHRVVWECILDYRVSNTLTSECPRFRQTMGADCFTSCALQPISGKLYQYFSLKWTYLSFLGIFEFGSLICATAVNSVMLIVGRAVAGMGAAGMFSGALIIVAHSIPLRQRPSKVYRMCQFLSSSCNTDITYSLHWMHRINVWNLQCSRTYLRWSFH